MPASSRKTDIASLLEGFLDDNEDNLSPNMFRELNELAGDIDESVSELQEEIEDLKQEKEELTETVKQLEE
ncbi:hypothetical protein DEU41_0577 [Bacillus sp. AG1163]|uniref:hypothetical protein n=1 Tax=Bacillus sp. AG1163 TaxID=2183999 RepID=UPI001066F2FD|nr:hypothetical protein [Bacillus sp. AG1163]TDT83136.1 hypothetical protein DEU41_0577 [Bacillus sp. AG1163]